MRNHLSRKMSYSIVISIYFYYDSLLLWKMYLFEMSGCKMKSLLVIFLIYFQTNLCGRNFFSILKSQILSVDFWYFRMLSVFYSICILVSFLFQSFVLLAFNNIRMLDMLCYTKFKHLKLIRLKIIFNRNIRK